MTLTPLLQRILQLVAMLQKLNCLVETTLDKTVASQQRMITIFHCQLLCLYAA